MLGLAVVFLLVIGMISYGAYLNYHDEHQITQRLAQQVLPLTGEKAKVRDIKPRLEVAPVYLSSGQMADAVALINGRIVEARVDKNEHVSVGDVLFVLHMPELTARLKQADSNVLKAETELLRCRNTYRRYTELRQADAVSAEKYDEVESAYHAAQADLEAAVAAREELLVQQREQQVLAPIDGEVIKLYHPTGTHISAGTSLALIGNFEQLYFNTSANETEAGYLAVGKEAVMSFNYEDFEKVYGTEYNADNRGREKKIITHLPPPERFAPLVYQRNSVYATHPERYGLELVPASWYDFLAPDDEEYIKDIAYTYEDAAPGGKTSPLQPLYDEMIARIHKWQMLSMGGQVCRLTGDAPW